jgi:hypothetical protein
VSCGDADQSIVDIQGGSVVLDDDVAALSSTVRSGRVPSQLRNALTTRSASPNREFESSGKIDDNVIGARRIRGGNVAAGAS